MELKEIIVCWDCSEPLKRWESLMTQDNTIDIWICNNVLCPRFGFLSTAFKTRERRNEDESRNAQTQ